MAARAAYLPGSDIEIDGELPMNRANAFGGHVYGQSALAAAWTWREIERERGAKPEERLDLHVSSPETVELRENGADRVQDNPRLFHPSRRA